MKLLIVISILVFTLTSCQTINKNNIKPDAKALSPISGNESTSILPTIVNTPEQLVGKKWVLKQLRGQVISIQAGEQPYAIFNIEKASISGYSGCNSFGGNCKSGNNTLKISMIMATKKFCLGSPEADFFRLLEQSMRYEIKNNQLELKDENEVLLVFQISR